MMFKPGDRIVWWNVDQVKGLKKRAGYVEIVCDGYDMYVQLDDEETMRKVWSGNVVREEDA